MSNRIKQLRKLRGLTQDQLAELAGLSKAYVGLLETGRRQLNERSLERVARALRCNPRDVIEGGDDDQDLRDHLDLVRSLPQPARENVYVYARTVQRAEAN